MSVRWKVDSKLDLREFNKLIKKLENLETWEAKAGFNSQGSHPRSGESPAYIATINNYGGTQFSKILGHDVEIPARPFMDFAMHYDVATLNDIMATSFTEFVYGVKNSQQTLRATAQQLKLSIEWALSSEIADQWVRNADLTIALKNSHQPLYETGWLINQIKPWVEKV